MRKKELKVAFVRRGYSPSGGAEAYLQRLGRGLVAQGIYPRLITTRDWPEAEWQFGKLERTRARDPLGFADEIERLHLRRKRMVIFSLERVWSCHIFRAGDGVHAAWLARKSKTQGALSWFAQRLTRKHGNILRLEESMLRQGRAELVIANSDFVRDEIVNQYGFPAERIRVIQNGVGVADFALDLSRREEMRRDLGFRPGEIMVLFVGSGWERKGLRYAIDSVEALHDLKFRLVVAGRGAARQYASRIAQFVGESRDVRSLYAAADILLAPTLYDPFSNACLEALASGLPVITTRDNGFSEIITHELNGSIVQHGSDVPALTSALQYWANPEKRERARATNVELATRYDISRNVEQTLALIIQAASAASTSAKIRKT